MAVDLVLVLGVGAVVFLAYVVYLAVRYPNRPPGTPDMPVPVPDGGLPIIGHALHLPKMTPVIHDWVFEMAHKYGDVVRFGAYIPGIVYADRVLTFNVKDVEAILRDPYLFPKGPQLFEEATDFFGHGIFVSDGDLWKVQRKVTSNVFNVKSFRDIYNPIFNADAQRLRDHLGYVAERCKTDPTAHLDIQDMLLRSTMDSFVRLALGADIGNLAGKGTFGPDGKYKLHDIPFATAFDSLNLAVAKRTANPLWKITELLDGTNARVTAYQKLMDDFALKIINQKRDKRRKGGAGEPSGPSGGESKDLIDLFLDLKNDDGSEVSDRQLQDMVRNMIIAGRDTTAQTTSWVVYRMAQHPDVAAKMREEMDRVLGPDKDALPDYAQMQQLKYTMAVFLETLRLHSNVPLNQKEIAEDTVLPGTGTKVYKGQRIMWATYTMGRLDRIWGKDALEFKPERWIDEKGSVRKEDAYKYPMFHAGPRICLGMDMAKQEAMVLMSALFRKYRLEPYNEEDPAKWGDFATKRARYDNQITLALRKSLDVRVYPVA
ncbi:cytochrome P450 [Hyaloraphidium curvatum]|nr:cytochrome P450 [Hyaloraphidium curvatum]